MEKRVVLAVVLTIALWFTFIAWFGPKPQPPAPPGQSLPVATGTKAATGGEQASTAPPQSSTPGGAPGAHLPSKQYPDVKDETLSNGRVDLTFAAKGGALRSASAWSCEYHTDRENPPPGDPGAATAWADAVPGALAVDLQSASLDVPDLAASNWKISKTDDAVVATFEGPGFVLTKTVRLSADQRAPWHADVVVEFRNVSLEPGTAPKTLEVFGPLVAMPKAGSTDTDSGVLLAEQGETLEVESAMRADVVAKMLAENPKTDKRSPTGRWAWIGARADFHLGALIPKTDLPPDASVGFRSAILSDPSGGPPRPVAGASFRVPLEVPAKGASTKIAFTFFAGPNQRALLQDETLPYHMLAGATLSRGFLGIKLTWISLLLGWLLRQLASTGMGYGLAVICLTILVRGALFPLSRKSQISMRLHGQKMQRLKPKLDAIKEKYKDAKKQQEATMKVMREEKVSILPGGCLLAFLQMPIWIALFGVLQSTFEMRHAGFLWVKDLTAQDHLLRLPFTDGWYVLNGWFNLLPILMMATWYASAAMQPLPDDPQQAQTAKMMRWMPVVMGLFLYGYAAGLALYMTMSAMWSIGETWLIRKLWLSKMGLAPGAAPIPGPYR
jgi:YidC/Oxa1 family membrane protein insertase